MEYLNTEYLIKGILVYAIYYVIAIKYFSIVFQILKTIQNPNHKTEIS